MKPQKKLKKSRRVYPEDLKQEAVQMLLDGHSASSICERLGIPRTNLLYKWKLGLVQDAGPVADAMDVKLKQLQAELYRVERERDILKKALGILGRNE